MVILRSWCFQYFLWFITQRSSVSLSHTSTAQAAKSVNTDRKLFADVYPWCEVDTCCICSANTMQNLTSPIEFVVFPWFQHNTIEAVLQRGEKLDDLVLKSEGLSTQSKTFYKTVCIKVKVKYFLAHSAYD